MSQSEVHAAVKRAQAARLLHGPELHDRPNISALEEFLIHGVKYVFPAERGGTTRGIPTAYAAEPLNRLITLSRGAQVRVLPGVPFVSTIVPLGC